MKQYKPLLSQSVTMLTRIHHEIKKAQASDVFRLYSIADTTEGNGPFYATFTPKAGIYSGQLHLLRIDFSYSYKDLLTDALTARTFPKDPPLIRFMTGIYHPNISTSGDICVDILGSNWNPISRLEVIINSILLLLEEPNCSSPLNCNAAKMYRTDKSQYAATAACYYIEKNKNPVIDPLLGNVSIVGHPIHQAENGHGNKNLSMVVSDYVCSYTPPKQLQ